MTIKEFAAKFKLRTKRDEDGEDIVLAKLGQIYAYSDTQFGVMFLTKSARLWNSRRQECEAAGMPCTQDGDTEGTLLFDPENKDQAKVAIRAVGARRKKELSPELRAQMAARLKNVRRVAQAG
jgi:hypothetical protein